MLVAAMPQRARENFRRVLLDENVALEREPGRHRLVALGEDVFHSIIRSRALHDESVGIPRVTVRASESAANVWIDGPESHPRDFRSVEDVLRERGVVANVLLLSNDGEHPRVSLECLAEQGRLYLSLRCIFALFSASLQLTRLHVSLYRRYTERRKIGRFSYFPARGTSLPIDVSGCVTR